MDSHFESIASDLHYNFGRYYVQLSVWDVSDITELIIALGSHNSTKKIKSSTDKNITLTIMGMDNEMIQKTCL